MLAADDVDYYLCQTVIPLMCPVGLDDIDCLAVRIDCLAAHIDYLAARIGFLVIVADGAAVDVFVYFHDRIVMFASFLAVVVYFGNRHHNHKCLSSTDVY